MPDGGAGAVGAGNVGPGMSPPQFVTLDLTPSAPIQFRKVADRSHCRARGDRSPKRVDFRSASLVHLLAAVRVNCHCCVNMSRCSPRRVALLLLGLAVASVAASSTDCPAGINVAGRGAVEAMPDQATVSLSVSSTKPQSADARDAAAAAASAVLAALSALGPSVNTTTTGVSVYQQTQLIDNSYVPVGYKYTQSLSVKVTNVTSELLTRVVDTAVTTGGNNVTVSSISTDLSPPLKQQAQQQAQEQAVANAQATASILAEASGVKLGPLVYMTTADATAVPTPYAAAAAAPAPGAPGAPGAASASTPITIGVITISASITATYSIS